MVGMQSTSFSFRVWLQHNFPRLGKMQESQFLTLPTATPTQSLTPQGGQPYTQQHTTNHSSQHFKQRPSSHSWWQSERKRRAGKKEWEFQSICNPPENNVINTTIHGEMNNKNHHSNVFPHYSINCPCPNQAMWATWAAIYFDIHLLCKCTFNPYW